MNDYLPDTPVVVPPECPTCRPDLDPRAYDVRYCEPHQPLRGGADDETVQANAYLTGSSESGGDDNRRWCDLLHRKVRLLRGG